MMHIKHRAPLLFAAGFAFCACGIAQQASPASNPFPSQPAPRPAAKPAPQPAAKPSPSHSSKPSPATPVAPPAPATPLLNQPSKPASVTLRNGQLTIKAHNSSLADILDRIAKSGGMKVDGLQSSADQRIFGVYGPGEPREVLTQLLTGCGFNMVMLGRTPAGTPKALSLSPRAPGGVPNPPAQPASAQYQNSREDYPAPQTAYPPPQPPPQQQPPHHVRTPQEILQELQRMRQSQQPK